MEYSMQYSLIFVKNDNHVLLGYKTRGLGAGLWNGFGGKFEDDDKTISNCAKRELFEESNLVAVNLKHIGVCKYLVENEIAVSIVHVFTCTDYTGIMETSDEMDPISWYNFNKVPLENMWPSTRYWFDFMLKDEFFSIICRYDNKGCLLNVDCKPCGSIGEAVENCK